MALSDTQIACGHESASRQGGKHAHAAQGASQGVHVVETDFVARIVGDGCAKSFSPSGLQIGLF